MSKRCLLIIFCLFICITQSVYADTVVTKEQIDTVINWANSHWTEYDDYCGGLVNTAFEQIGIYDKGGDCAWNNSSPGIAPGASPLFDYYKDGKKHNDGGPGCHASQYQLNMRAITPISIDDIKAHPDWVPDGAILYWANDEYHCDGHTGIYHVAEITENGQKKLQAQVCDSVGSCREISSYSSKWCYNDNGTSDQSKWTPVQSWTPLEFQGWTFWKGYELYSEKNYGTLDVNGLLDGIPWGSTAMNDLTYGTFDVYINGNKVKDNEGDYVDRLEEGTTYLINDIRAAEGFIYKGPSSYSGTITANNPVNIQLEFNIDSAMLDVNGILDGVELGGIDGWGTFDVFLNKEYYGATQAPDYYERLGAGADYEIMNIKANDGFAYVGYEVKINDEFSYAGTDNTIRGYITAGNNVKINLKFNSCYLNVDGLLDGVPADNIGQYGTFTMNLNGQNHYNQTDFWQQVRNGSGYAIYDIKANEGYTFVGIHSGAQSGQVTGGRTTIVLEFKTNEVPGQWYERSTLPSWVNPDEYDIEYKGHSSIQSSASPGDGWERVEGSGTTTYENSGDVYSSQVELPTSDTRIPAGYYYYHWCGRNAGITVNHDMDTSHPHWDGISNPNSVIETGEYYDNDGYKYYKLQWTSGGDAYCSSGVTCDGSNGTHGNHSYYWYKMYLYQDRVAGETVYTWVKDTDWQSSSVTGADSVSYRFRLKESDPEPDTTPKGRLDVNGLLDGINSGDTAGFGTFDVYINGERIADDETDLCRDDLPDGAEYEIRDIKVNSGYSYNGLANGELIGTISAENETNVRLIFDTVQSGSEPKTVLNVNGILDGVFSDSMASSGTEYGTFDIYINNKLFGNDQFDFYHETLAEGTTYEIKDIKAFDGYSFEGYNGSLQGTVTAGQTTEVQLKFDPCYLNVDGWQNGTPSDNIAAYGTFDIRVNDQSYTNQTDFREQVSLGSNYVISNVRPKDGYIFTGVHSGSLEGTTESKRTTIVLEFAKAVVTGKSIEDAVSWAESGISGDDNIKGTINGYDYTDNDVTLSYLVFDAYEIPRITTATDFVASQNIEILNAEDAGSTNMADGWNKAPRGAILVWKRYLATYGKEVSFIGIARGDGTMVTAMTDYGVTDARIWYFNNNQTQNQGYVYQGWGFFKGYDFNNGTVVISDSIPKGRLDVNGLLDGVSTGNTQGFGTFDVYIDGVQAADDAYDYSEILEEGTEYEIKDIIAFDGYTYKGLANGELTGTIVPEVETNVRLIFDSKQTVSHTVTFKVVNGSWNDGTTADKTVIVSSYEGDTLKLSSEDIPAVGANPSENYKAGGWDTMPNTETAINADTAYTYTYEPKFNIDAGGKLIGYYGTDENVVVPYGVTAIGGSVFMNNTSMKTIVLPDTVKSIEDLAFAACNNLTEITIPDSVNRIGYAAFQGCSSLKSLTLPVNLKTISDGAFRGCRSLESLTLPEGLLVIGERAFQECSSLTEISIPENVTSIGNYAFADCTNVDEIDLSNSISSIGEGAFCGCSSLKEVTVPEKITSIGASTFAGCSDLSSVSLPSGVTSIGNYAFSGCRNLSELVIPENVTTLGDGAFSGCSSIDNLILPAGITVINPALCNGCSGLSSIIIPEAVTKIENNAFNNCINLETVYLPDSVISIDYYAFGACSSLTDVYYSGLNAEANKISIGTGNNYLNRAAWHYGHTVTFKVVNGAWNDGTTADKTVTISGYDGEELKLASDQIPAAGNNPSVGYLAGSWDVLPDTNTIIEENKTYTYTYTAKTGVSHVVTFKVANGTWDDGSTADKTVTLNGYEGDELKLASDQIPAVGSKPNSGYEGGAWDTEPGTAVAITADTTYTYTYNETTDGGKLTVSTVKSSPGKEVTIGISLSENPGILALSLGFSYDRTRLSFTGYEDSGLTDWIVTDGKMIWLGNSNSSYNGEILKLKFTILEDAEDGDAFITLTCEDGDMVDDQENTYIPAIESGKVQVMSYLPGDMTGDWKVNAVDLVRLKRFLGGEPVTLVASGDVTNDGKINAVDLVRLKRYLGGENVEIH